jgi:hypothetical protein
MGLETDAVDFDTTSLETLDDVLGGSCFGGTIFEVIVVVVEFDGGVILRSGHEGDGNEFGADLFMSAGCMHS